MRIPGRTDSGGGRSRTTRYAGIVLALLLMVPAVAATASALPPDPVHTPTTSAAPAPDEQCTGTTCDSTQGSTGNPGGTDPYPGCRTGVGPCPYSNPCVRNPDAPGCTTDPCTGSDPPSTCETPPVCSAADPPPTCPKDPDPTVPCEPDDPQCPTGGGTSNPVDPQPDPRPDPGDPDAGTPDPQPGSSNQPDPAPDTGRPGTGRPGTAQPPVSEDREPTGSAALILSPTAVAPGGAVTASGRGCEPGAAVELTIGGTPVGTAVAAADGSFTAELALSAIEVGRHDVQAWCGRPLTAQLDVVLVSSVDSGAATVAILLFFLLLGGWFYGHRLISHRSTRRDR